MHFNGSNDMTKPAGWRVARTGHALLCGFVFLTGLSAANASCAADTVLVNSALVEMVSHANRAAAGDRNKELRQLDARFSLKPHIYAPMVEEIAVVAGGSVYNADDWDLSTGCVPGEFDPYQWNMLAASAMCYRSRELREGPTLDAAGWANVLRLNRRAAGIQEDAGIADAKGWGEIAEKMLDLMARLQTSKGGNQLRWSDTFEIYAAMEDTPGFDTFEKEMAAKGEDLRDLKWSSKVYRLNNTLFHGTDFTERSQALHLLVEEMQDCPLENCACVLESNDFKVLKALDLFLGFSGAVLSNKLSDSGFWGSLPDAAKVLVPYLKHQPTPVVAADLDAPLQGCLENTSEQSCFQVAKAIHQQREELLGVSATLSDRLAAMTNAAAQQHETVRQDVHRLNTWIGTVVAVALGLLVYLLTRTKATVGYREWQQALGHVRHATAPSYTLDVHGLPQRPFDVFLAFSGELRAMQASTFKESLTYSGLRTFIDCEMASSALPGPRDQMQFALETCRHAVVLVSPGFFNRNDPCRELAYVFSKQRWIERQPFRWQSLWVVFVNVSINDYKQQRRIKAILPDLGNEVTVKFWSDGGTADFRTWNQLCNAVKADIVHVDRNAGGIDGWKRYLRLWSRPAGNPTPLASTVYS